MGIICLKCGSTNTISREPGKMWCRDCGREWTPYKHRGKKMKIVGDGILTTRRKVIPGAKTRVIGDDIITRKRRIKKTKVKRNIFGF